MVITADAIASATPLVPITVSNAPATISVEICLAAAYLSRYKIYVSPRTPMVFVKVPAIEATPIEIVENVKRVPQAMALLDAGRYIIKLKLVNEENVEEKMASLLNENAWETLKKSKKGEKMADIKPLVKELKYWVKDGELVINALIATGSRENLSADLLAKFITSKIENVNTESFVNIKREEMYVLKNNKYVPLFKAL